MTEGATRMVSIDAAEIIGLVQNGRVAKAAIMIERLMAENTKLREAVESAAALVEEMACTEHDEGSRQTHTSTQYEFYHAADKLNEAAGRIRAAALLKDAAK